MRVLLLTHSFVRWKGDFAGAFLLDLAKGLQAKEVKVVVIAPHSAQLPPFEIIDEMPVYRFQYASPKLERLTYKGNMHELIMQNTLNKIIFIKYIVSCFLKTLVIASKEKVNIIHAHWWVPSGIIALLVSKISGKPYIITSHGSDVFMMRKFKILIPLAKIVFKNADFITVVSKGIKTFLIKNIGIEAAKIGVFPMPCDFSLFYPCSVGAIHELPLQKTVLSVGRLIKWKGHKYLIEAIYILRTRGKNVGTDYNLSLHIIGGGPEEMELKRQIKELNLEDCIEIIPFQPKNELNYFYNLCDIFILPSITDTTGSKEGFGLVLLEAMSCKKPVIGTNSGGIPDIVKDGETGLLVPEKDVNALVNAITRLLENRDLSNKLAENGYNFVKENFTISKITDKMINVYKKIKCTN